MENENKQMWYRILGGVTIQLSDHYIPGYSLVIKDEVPEYDPETQYLVDQYVIIDNEVHHTYEVKEKEIKSEVEVDEQN